MSQTEFLLIALLLAVLIAIVLLVLLLLRRPDAAMAALRESLEARLREEQRQGRSELREVIAQMTHSQSERIDGFARSLSAFDANTGEQFGKLRDALVADARQARGEASDAQTRHQQVLGEKVQALTQSTDTRLEALRLAMNEDAQKLRSESSQTHERHNTALTQRINELTERTDKRLDEFRIAIIEDARKMRSESAEAQRQLGESIGTRVRELTERNAHSISELRTQVEGQLKTMQADNAQKLEQMRATVDEKLQSTLETRLGESFRQVSERLEAVQRGLGEMQQLAADVGSLQRVLTNVKTRGTFGEVQLAALLEQVLVAEQYAANVATVPGASERVEYAVRLPGANGDANSHVWLPIDAKFPREDYERLLDAIDRNDAEAIANAGAGLERQIKVEAKRIRDKYIAPPHTTDFALLFLPTEGLYAEVIRRPGLFDALQREFRVTVVGPTTLLALLNALQMGFRTLAIEQRSSEVWQLLGVVKTEFGKFAGVLENADKQLSTVQNSMKAAGVRTRAIERKLRKVEALPLEGDAAQLLGDIEESAESDSDDA